MILKDLNEAWGICKRQAERTNTHFDAISLYGEEANDGIFFNLRNGEVTNGWADWPRAELLLPDPVETDETYEINLKLSLPAFENHRKTLFQWYPRNEQGTRSSRQGPALTLVSRYKQNFIKIKPVDGSEKTRWLLPDQSGEIDITLTIAPDHVSLGMASDRYAEVIHTGSICSDRITDIKFGLYTERFTYDRTDLRYSGSRNEYSYPGWRKDLAMDYVLYRDISIEEE